MEYKADENLHTLHNRIKNIGMDTKYGGGIHLWITGNPVEFGEKLNPSYSISVHLSKEEAVMLVQEILYRIMHEFENRVKSTINDIKV